MADILADNIAFDENGLYIPQTWLDGVGEGNFTPLTADRMNHIEQGIKGLSESWDSISQIRKIVSVQLNFGTMQADSWISETVDLSAYNFEKKPYRVGNYACVQSTRNFLMERSKQN